MNSAPQWFSSQRRQPAKAPVLFGLMNLAMHEGSVLHCEESHWMLSVQHSMQVGPEPAKRLASSKLILASRKHLRRSASERSPPRMEGLANLAAQRVISVVMKRRVS